MRSRSLAFAAATWIALSLVVTIGLIAAASAAEPERVDLIRDDFSRFPPGELSSPIGQLNPAIQEYHYLAHRGVPLEPWANAIGYLDCWIVGDEDDRPYLEQHLSPDNRRMEPKLFSPQFVTGEPEWRDCAVEVDVQPLATHDFAGIVFRYRTNRHHALFSLRNGNEARLAIRLPLETAFRVAGWKELGTATFEYEATRYYRLKVENDGPKIRCFVDGKLVVEAEDDSLPAGKVGVSSNVPTRFRDFRASVSPATKRRIEADVAARNAGLATLQAGNPRPTLWKTFDTPKYGCGRNVRFGDLDGDGRPEMLFCQNIKKVDTGNFVEISCLTAVTLEGKVLWQRGRPDPRNGLLTSDCPFQIHDVDGDGRNDVAIVKDFKLQILDGRTGETVRSALMPKVPDDLPKLGFEIKERPHELNMGDSISFFNLTGDKGRRDLLVKDRYRFFWTFDRNLKPLWSGGGMLGHFPLPWDGAGDGFDRVLIGYAMWDRTGKRLWSHDDELRDHADGIAFGNFSGDPNARPMGYYSGSDEGFVLIDGDGGIRKHHRVGHTQTACVGKFRPDLPGLQYAAINFWKNPGIVTLFDSAGDILTQAEPVHCGSPFVPVNWRGDGAEFILLSTNVREGGLLDGDLRRAVVFPDDGHPDLCSSVLDLTGDARDEIVTWDQDRVWIYTQDRPFEGKRIYAPTRNPDCNDSNYRTTISLPAWKNR